MGCNKSGICCADARGDEVVAECTTKLQPRRDGECKVVCDVLLARQMVGGGRRGVELILTKVMDDDS